MRFHHDIPARWADSELRTYLREEFLEELDLGANIQYVMNVSLETPANPWFPLAGGQSTTTPETVFILSIEEVIMYLGGCSELLSNGFLGNGYISDAHNTPSYSPYSETERQGAVGLVASL